MVKTGPKISYSIPQNATKFYWTDDVSTIPSNGGAGRLFNDEVKRQDKAGDPGYDISGSLLRSFTSRFGTIHCKELIGFDLGDPKERGKAFESGVFAGECAGFVRFCAQEVNEHLLL